MTNRKWMRVLLVLTVSVLSILLAACSSPEKAASTKQETVQEPADWAIYWYLCGSDLESKHGAASADLDEMLKIKLPENMKVVIETGGATKWKNKSRDLHRWPCTLVCFIFRWYIF